MKWRSTAFVLLFGALTAIAQSTPLDKNPPETSDTKFDATRLRIGRFEYRIVRDGKQIATFTITVDKQSDGNFRFAAKGFNQEWESVASSSFHPISAALRIERRKTKKTYSMSLTYGGDRVSGSREPLMRFVPFTESKNRRERKLTKSWPAKRRRALWFAKISPPGCPPNW